MEDSESGPSVPSASGTQESAEKPTCVLIIGEGQSSLSYDMHADESIIVF